ncbi:MAG: hypothetical protein WC523_05030 [Patescibacteria group bacterium]
MKNNIAKYAKKSKDVLKKCYVPQKMKASSPAKISLKENCAFSLLPGPKYSCPGATDACKNCYAMKKRFLFPSAIKAYSENWLLYKKLKKDNDLNGLVEKLSNIVPKGAKIFRIGESGDFVSSFYIDAWKKVIESRPEIKFYAYTRSFRFKYFDILKLPNFNLLASTDRYNNKRASVFVKKYRKYGVKRAYGPWRNKNKIPKNSFICPATNNKLKIAGACEKCNLCIVKGRMQKHVVFLRH